MKIYVRDLTPEKKEKILQRVDEVFLKFLETDFLHDVEVSVIVPPTIEILPANEQARSN